MVDIRHLLELLCERNNEQAFFGELFDLIGSFEKGVEFFDGEFSSGLVGKNIMKEVAYVDCGGHLGACLER